MQVPRLWEARPLKPGRKRTAVGAQPPAGRGQRLDQVRLRGPQRAGAVPASIDLGNEPPLSVDGEARVGIDRRRISVQWFSGTILTGLCGAALMGGAVFASLDGETNFAANADRYQAHAPDVAADKNTAHKSDRLPALGEANLARQVIPISTITKVGNREVMRKRKLVRVETNLALSTTELSANLPPFNPQRMLADGSPTSANDEAAAPEPDDAVSFVTRDLAAILPCVRITATVPIEDVISRVRDAANWTGSVEQPRYLVASAPPNARLGYAAETADDLYAGFGARGVPENITLLPKTAPQATGGTGSSERTVTARKGDSVGAVLRDLGAPPDDIKAIVAALGAKGRDGGLRDGERVRVLMSPIPGSGGRLQPARVMLLGDTSVEAVVALSDMGGYVPVDVQSAETAVTENTEEQDQDDGSGVRLYQSIYETALRNQVPRPIADELIRIYSYDVDFQRKAEPGDSFQVLYDDEGAGADAKNEVLFAALTVGGETKKFYRYLSPTDGLVDYYDDTGKSAKKFLVRKPLAEGIMRSGFGIRKHPILGFVRAHTGVDWAAPRGTQIYASGNGTIEEIGPKNGYGKYIRIRHANGYETAYAHMSAYARNMAIGTRVHQGQVIGYVGSTGLATGPHLHYEIIINTRFVDPMKVKLPRGRVLEGTELTSFDRERDRINGIMAQAAMPTRTAAAK
jgi:murein DD-endopeptidase MepM/ murein hydrolase activator NlpD